MLACLACCVPKLIYAGALNRTQPLCMILVVATPMKIIVGIAVFGFLLAAFLLFRSSKAKNSTRRFWYLTLNMLGIDVGLRGIAWIVLLSLVASLIVAIPRGFSTGQRFDWRLVLEIFGFVVFLQFLNNFLNTSRKLRDFFAPKSGRKWLGQRKTALAGIIKKINIHIASDATPSESEIKQMLRDVLDLIVLHVRDYRGSHDTKRKEVFASLLINANDDELAVVMRDSLAHSTEYKRPIPAFYRRELMLCGNAMFLRKALSIGMLSIEDPEGPKDKPYKSILAMPLFNTANDEVYGCLSVDCSKPYFFQSFEPDQVENEMENSLQPYLQLITMILECFLGRSAELQREKLLGV